MPVYDLNAKQRDDIAQYLATLSEDNSKARTPVREFDARKVKQGREVVAQNRCNACHQMPGEAILPADEKIPALGPGSLWREACLGGTGRRDCSARLQAGRIGTRRDQDIPSRAFAGQTCRNLAARCLLDLDQE